MPRASVACAAVVLLAAPPAARPLHGQPAVAPGDSPVDRAVAHEVVRRAARAAESLYVFPDRGRALAESLRGRLARGEYDAPGTAAELADRVTRDMRAESGDLHFALLTPAAGRAVGAPAAQGAPAERGRALLERERRANFFFTRLELLPGGVAYVRLDQFPVRADSARRVAAAAMAMASAADAVILDLRRNPGGGEGLNQFLSSYFYPADTSRVLYERHFRDGSGTARFRVLADLPGPRIPFAPLYILTSRRTGSAAENMAYHLQASGRAVIVGERTAGAANTSRPVPLEHGYGLVVPVARVLSPITGTNWEGGGVRPDLPSPPDSALDAAYATALERLAETVAEPGDATRQRALAVARARRSPATPTSRELVALAGRFREWTVSVASAGLRVARDDGPSYLVSMIARDAFAAPDEPEVQFAFERDAAGRAAALRVLRPSGEWTRVPHGRRSLNR